MKISMDAIIKSRDYYKDKIKTREKRIKKMMDSKFPNIILDNEERQLRECKMNAFAFELAIKAYKAGFKDGTNNNYHTMNKFDRHDLTPEEVLERAIFGGYGDE